MSTLLNVIEIISNNSKHRRVQRGGGGQGVLTPPFTGPPLSSVTPPSNQPNPGHAPAKNIAKL